MQQLTIDMIAYLFVPQRDDDISLYVVRHSEMNKQVNQKMENENRLAEIKKKTPIHRFTKSYFKLNIFLYMSTLIKMLLVLGVLSSIQSYGQEDFSGTWTGYHTYYSPGYLSTKKKAEYSLILKKKSEMEYYGIAIMEFMQIKDYRLPYHQDITNYLKVTLKREFDGSWTLSETDLVQGYIPAWFFRHTFRCEIADGKKGKGIMTGEPLDKSSSKKLKLEKEAYGDGHIYILDSAYEGDAKITYCKFNGANGSDTRIDAANGSGTLFISIKNNGYFDLDTKVKVRIKDDIPVMVSNANNLFSKGIGQYNTGRVVVTLTNRDRILSDNVELEIILYKDETHKILDVFTYKIPVK